MSRGADDVPERLLTTDATNLERRLLEAAARARRPSRAVTARMAKAVGVTAGVVTTVAATKAVAASKAGVTAGASTVWPWISVGVLGLAVTAVVVGYRARHAPPAPSSITAPSSLGPPFVAPPPPAAMPAAPAPGVLSSGRRSRPTLAAELSDQVALIDDSRAALSVGANRRALETLRRYQERYPTGSFRPEVTALKIEALVKLGRLAEARALADRFVEEHPGSLLADRVRALIGPARP